MTISSTATLCARGADLLLSLMKVGTMTSTSVSLRFGLIGSGRIGQVHARSIAAHPGASLAWIADPFLDGAITLSQIVGGSVTEHAEEIIDPARVDALVIASPTPTHVDLIRAALHAGVPVLCEKPIDLDLNRVDELAPLVRSSGVPVAIGFNRRFDPGFASARARVAAGEIGDLEQLTITSRDPAAPPASYIAVSGGIFRDMTIHDFDMARFFLPHIVSVQATASTLFDPGAHEHGDYDTAVIVLRAESGAVVTITNSRHSAFGYDQRLEAFGAAGMLQVANAPTSLVSSSSSTQVEVKPPYQNFFLERYAEAYAAELDAFISLVRGAESSSPSFADGRAALALADAAALSARTGETVTFSA